MTRKVQSSLPAVLAAAIITACNPALAQENGNTSPAPATAAPVVVTPNEAAGAPVTLRPALAPVVPVKPLTLSGAVQYAQINYPSIIRAAAETKAAQENVTVQKINEYMPDSLMQFQEVMASHNKLTQIIYGSPVFPANPGPGFNTVGMNPSFFSGVGFNLDWQPIDFGLHKARINLAKSQYSQARAQLGVTLLDVQLAAAGAFLDAVEADSQVVAAEENVKSFGSFKTIVSAQVKAQLKPGADLALAEAELANAQNQLYRAQMNQQVARINLANAIGFQNFNVLTNDAGLTAYEEQGAVQTAPPVFSAVPILQAAHATYLTALAQRHVLSKEYFPTIHFLGGIQNRGASLNTKGNQTWIDGAGLIPTVPNYQVAVIINWNFLDYFRLKAEKRVQNQRVLAQQAQYNLVLLNLRAEDARSRARVKMAIDVAQNMPLQVSAAEQASQQAQARYSVGLSSVAQVAEANQVLANSRMQEAVARVAVWRAMLGVAAAHGDVGPFIAEADRVQRGM